MARNGRRVSVRQVDATRAGNESQRVAAALEQELAVSGVNLVFDKDTPIFTADPNDPDLVLRKLAGKITRGRFEGGVFIELP
jgi:hypothetical protein